MYTYTDARQGMLLIGIGQQEIARAVAAAAGRMLARLAEGFTRLASQAN